MTLILLNNLCAIGIAFGIYILCVLANICASVYYNTQKVGQKLNFKKFINGIYKMLSIGATTALLAVVVTFIPYVPYLGDIIPADSKDFICITGVVILYGKAIIKYFIEAYQTENDILNNRNILDDINNEED